MTTPPICKVLAAAAALFLGTTGAQATVTLQFGSPTIHASNWGDTGGGGTTKLVWGILIDSAGNGFLPISDSYSGQGLSLTAGAYQPLQDNLTHQPTDDLLFLSPALMIPVTNTNDGGVVGQNRITTIANVPIGIGPSHPVDSGDHFMIVWFDSTVLNGGSMVGMRFGFFDNPAFVLPSDGATQPFTSIFTGPDALKPMTAKFDTPEPSTLMLSALGALGLIRRRRGSAK